MLMDMVLVAVMLFILGACLGSFAVASVWRLRAYQLAADKKQGHKLTKQEAAELKTLTKLRGKKGAKDRSVCLDCGYRLEVRDLIPIVSWLWLKGKCRKCKKPIGRTELIAEVGLGAALVISYLAWPLGFTDWTHIALFVLFATALFLLTIHMVYDAKWYLLLDVITGALLVVAVAFVVLLWLSAGSALTMGHFWQVIVALAILPGFYWLLYVISKGAWIGFGDVKLLVPLALMLPDWTYAFLVLFLANVLGCIWIMPGMLAKKITRTTRIPFGPFLIVAWVIAMLWGGPIIAAYMGTMLF